MLTPVTISIIKNIPKKEERALRLEKETSRQLARFTSRMQRKISPVVTQEEISEIIQSGFDRGDFCKDISKLAGPAKIRKYVKAELKRRDPSKDDVSQIISKVNEVDQCEIDDSGEALP